MSPVAVALLVVAGFVLLFLFGCVVGRVLKAARAELEAPPPGHTDPPEDCFICLDRMATSHRPRASASDDPEPGRSEFRAAARTWPDGES